MDPSRDDSSQKLTVILYRNGMQIHSCRLDDKLLIGRREVYEPPPPAVVTAKSGEQKLVASDHDFAAMPRTFVKLEKQPGHQICVSNLHKANTFTIEGMGVVAVNQSVLAAIPCNLNLPGGFSITVIGELARAKELPQDLEGISLRSRPRVPFKDSDSHDSIRSLSLSGTGSSVGKSILGSLLGDSSNTVSIGASDFLDILDFVVASAQKPATSNEFYQGIAEAVNRLVGMDRAEVLFWDGKAWDRSEDRMHITVLRADIEARAPSSSLLNRVLSSKQIVVYPEDMANFNSESVRKIVAAIACPILDEKEELIGVLYADRASSTGESKGRISGIEEKLIEILTNAIATGMAKTKRESLVTTYQQFFSSKVVEAIQQNPKLLTGEICDVSVLFCDIRGFSRITERIGPAAAMLWIQDTLSELSDRVLGLEGVLVDYVGDALFAMWGAPDNQPHHALASAFAANKMMSLSLNLSERWRKSIPEGFEFGIGLCTGPAQVGNVGSKQKFKYGPMGSTVNLGSRIQGLTSQWRVQTMMNEETAVRLPADVPKRRLCQAKVKGMDGSVTLYELVAEQDYPLEELRKEYEQALAHFESGEHRESARGFGDLVKRYPKDGPSIVMLVRAVQEVANPSEKFDPIWVATSK
ncbi:MAG: adenylate/guanylate cyclase domain-containing protein [Pirellulaceae bacterium]|nr:adenylate/guanylate cyclase domain-containing protein [Pirellulaceae bacterium]